MAVVAATETAAPPAMTLALWRGVAANRTATKVEMATDAAAAMVATEAVAKAAAAQQEQRCRGSGGIGIRGGRGGRGNSSGSVNREGAATKAAATTKGQPGQQS